MCMKKIFLFIIFFVVVAIVQPTSSGAVLSSQEGGIFMVDDFNQRKMFNLLGGKTQGYEEAGVKCIPTFATSPEETRAGKGPSLRLDFNVSAPNSFSYYWTKLITEYAGAFSGKTFEARAFKDLSGYDYLSFWLMDPQGGADFAVELHQDVDGDGTYIMGKDKISSIDIAAYNDVTMRGKWQEIVIPLSGFRNITDWGKILEIVFVFRHGRGIDKGTVYIDDVCFGSNPPKGKVAYKICAE